MEPITLITTIGGVCGAIATTIALLALIIKPLRTKLANWVGKTANTQEFNAKFDDINDKIDRVTELVTKTIEQNEKLQEDINLQKNASQASLRNSILNACQRCIAKDSATMYEMKNIEEMFKIYEDLNGNGFVHLKVEKVRSLKEEE